MKRLIVFIFACFGILQTTNAQNKEDKAVGLWYFQYDSTATSDKLGNSFPSFFSSLRIDSIHQILIPVNSFGKYKVEQSVNFDSTKSNIQLVQQFWNEDTLRFKSQKNFKVVTLTDDSLVLLKIGSKSKIAKDSFVVFRKFKPQEIDSMIVGKQWINKVFNYNTIQTFSLQDKTIKYPRPYLVYDFTRAHHLKVEYPFGGGFNGKQMQLEAVNDTMLRIYNFDEPGIWHNFNILAFSANGFELQEINPTPKETNLSNSKMIDDDELAGNYLWKSDTGSNISKLILKKDKTFTFSYSNDKGDTTIYGGVFFNHAFNLQLYPWGFEGNENLEWGNRMDKKVQKFYLGTPLKIALNYNSRSHKIDLSCKFVGGEGEMIFTKESSEDKP